jgi:hypothetical protein
VVLLEDSIWQTY